MAADVFVSSVASAVGVPVAAEQIGTTHVQLVKLLGGDVGSMQPIPGNSAQGLGVQILNQPTVAVSGPVQVSGAVSISVMPAVSGTVSVSGPVQVSGTVTANVSGAVSISGTVVVSGAIIATTTQASGITGALVYLAASQTVHVTVDNAVGISGVVSVSVLPAISISVSAVLGTVITILGTQVVTLATGGVVTLVGTAAVNLGTAVFIGSTTAVSGVSGPQVWLGASQSIIVNTIAVGFSVNALVTGPVSISAMPAVSISVSAVLGTIITQLGTQVVTLATGGVVTMVGAVSVTGVSLNVVVSGPVSVSAMPAVSISVSAVLGTVITVLGTQIVTLATGASVTMVGAVSVTGVSLNVVVSGPVSVSAMPAISISVSAALGTIITVLGTQIVTLATGGVVTMVGVVSITGTSVNVVVSGVVSVSAMPSIAISTNFLTTATPAADATGLKVWQVNPGNVSVSVGQAAPFGGYLEGIVTTTAVSSSTQVLLQSVYVSTGSTLGTSGWTVGSGSVLAVYGLAFGWSQAAANMQATFMMMVTASGTTLSTVSPAWAQVTYSTAAAGSTIISTGFVPGTVVGLNSSITQIPFPWLIPGPAVIGFAVAATSIGATVYASVNAQILNTIPFAQPVTGSVGISGSVVVSGVVLASTTQVAGTGAIMWLAPTQTVGILSTVVTILGTQLVSIVTIPVGTAIAFQYTTAVAGTVLTQPVVTIAFAGTTVATSLYVVPAGKVLRLFGMNCFVKNTAASIGFANIEAYVIASASSSVAVGPVYGYVAAANGTSATNAGVAGYANLGGMEISAGFTVQFPVKVTGLSSCPAQVLIVGDLI